MKRRIVFGLLLGFAPGLAQAPRLEFEVATVRPTDPSRMGMGSTGFRGGPGTPNPGRVSYSNLELEDLIVQAFQLRRYQITPRQPGGDARFDIVAKVPEGATPETVRSMLQNLLIERWRLRTHREQRQMPVYALVAGKDGIKMKPSGAGAGDPDSGGIRMGASGCPEIPGGRLPSSLFIALGAYCVTGTGQTMAGLAEMLSGQFDRPVLDLTETTGKYDFSMRFSAAGLRSSAILPPGAPPPSDTDTSGAPDIYSEMQRLGLRMESRKAPVEVLVIDHAEKMPIQN